LVLVSCGLSSVLLESCTTRSMTRLRGFSVLLLCEPQEHGVGPHDTLFRGGVRLEFFLPSPSPEPLGLSSFFCVGSVCLVGLGTPWRSLLQDLPRL
jgi:hypothetical protein